MQKFLTTLFESFYLLTITTFVSTSVIPLSLLQTTKSEICPHGVHYINSCKNACSCDPRYGGAMCSRMTNCDDSNGSCPFGSTFTDPMWGSNFQCQCNRDKSQTYECFDLSLLKNYNHVYNYLIHNVNNLT